MQKLQDSVLKLSPNYTNFETIKKRDQKQGDKLSENKAANKKGKHDYLIKIKEVLKGLKVGVEKVISGEEKRSEKVEEEAGKENQEKGVKEKKEAGKVEKKDGEKKG